MAGQNWQYATPVDVGGSVTYNGGTQAIAWRDPLDAARSMQGDRIPTAEYPDGYLGTIQGRRNDRLLNQMHVRANEKQYDRGVHKGSRLDPADYFFPPGMGPGDRLRQRAVQDGPLQYVQRPAPVMTMNEMLVVRGSQSLRAFQPVDPRPPWS